MDGDEPKLLSNSGGPPVTSKQGMDKLHIPVPLPGRVDIVAPLIARAQLDSRKRKLPQCIAHRGFRAKFPENTVLAFKEAIKAGAIGIETDVHLTKDDVVVISHDPSPKRCYGLKGKIIDYTWDELKDLRSIAEPHVPMPRLRDVLDFLNEHEFHQNWLLLDIKMTNNDDNIMRLIASTIASVQPVAREPWSERIVLGIWAAKYLPLAVKYSPQFPLVHIGIHRGYARHFFSVPNVGISMLTAALLGPGGKAFIRDCQEKYHRILLAWTVNSKDRMEWCIRQGLDGLITDDPEMYGEVCREYDEDSPVPRYPMPLWSWLGVLQFCVLVNVLHFIFRKRFRPVASLNLVGRENQ